jgi:hypothetical protein
MAWELVRLELIRHLTAFARENLSASASNFDLSKRLIGARALIIYSEQLGSDPPSVHFAGIRPKACQRARIRVNVAVVEFEFGPTVRLESIITKADEQTKACDGENRKPCIRRKKLLNLLSLCRATTRVPFSDSRATFQF